MILSICLFNQAYAAEISYKDKGEFTPTGKPRFLLQLTGPIAEGDATNLGAIVENIHAEGDSLIFSDFQISLDSPGGDLDASIELARKIQKWGIATHIGSGKRCLSGCAIAFMAGRWLGGDNSFEPRRVLHPKGVLGFHAPFVSIYQGKIDPEIEQLLLKDAERGGTIAASKLVKLTLDRTLSSSLVESLLQYDAGSFLYINTLDQVGRWGIALEGASSLKNQGDGSREETSKRLARHCENMINWAGDVALENRIFFLNKLDEGTLTSYGMNYSCEYKPNGRVYNAKIDEWDRDVIYWQTLPPDTLIADLSEGQLLGLGEMDNPFSTPPDRLVSGPCRQGYQWVGGWKGETFANAQAFAEYRSCNVSQTLYALRCSHGDQNVQFLFLLNVFNRKTFNLPHFERQVDNGHKLGQVGRTKTTSKGANIIFGPIYRGHWNFDEMMSGRTMTFSAKENQRDKNFANYSMHLDGSREAITAMFNACL